MQQRNQKEKIKEDKLIELYNKVVNKYGKERIDVL